MGAARSVEKSRTWVIEETGFIEEYMGHRRMGHQKTNGKRSMKSILPIGAYVEVRRKRVKCRLGHGAGWE